MKRHQITFRLGAADHAALKSAADAAGTTVPVAARMRCLQNLEIEPRLAAIEQRLAGMPTNETVGAAFKHLAAKIDRVDGGAK